MVKDVCSYRVFYWNHRANNWLFLGQIGRSTVSVLPPVRSLQYPERSEHVFVWLCSTGCYVEMLAADERQPCSGH